MTIHSRWRRSLHDLVGKLLGAPWYKIWGLDKTLAPDTTFTIGIDTPEVVREKTKECADMFNILKVKVGSDHDKEMIETIRAFIRYHFVTGSVYADNVVDGGVYGTACSDTLGIREKLTVSGGGNTLTVTDNRGNQVSVNGNSGKIANQMTRDYVFSHKADAVDRNGKPQEKSITTS